MNIREFLRLKKTDGDVGLEIEMEGVGLVPINNAIWRTERDGSLRGESMECVLKSPLTKVGVVEAITQLNKHLRENKCKVDDSPRAGTHVHINVQELELTQLFSFITLYMCFEEVLVRYCGDDRIGNLFCFRVSDAEGLLTNAISAARTGELRRLNTDRIRYASMNLKAVTEYGSLEFRAMRGTVDKEVLTNWIGMLLAIRDYSKRFTPDQLVSNFSVMGPQDFFNEVLGDYRGVLHPEEYELNEGMRNAQELAFCRDWNGAFNDVIELRQRVFQVAYDLEMQDEEDEEDF